MNCFQKPAQRVANIVNTILTSKLTMCKTENADPGFEHRIQAITLLCSTIGANRHVLHTGQLQTTESTSTVVPRTSGYLLCPIAVRGSGPYFFVVCTSLDKLAIIKYVKIGTKSSKISKILKDSDKKQICKSKPSSATKGNLSRDNIGVRGAHLAASALVPPRRRQLHPCASVSF